MKKYHAALATTRLISLQITRMGLYQTGDNMLSRSLTLFFTLLITSILVSGCATKRPDESQYSGFLQDYSQVKNETDATGDKVLRFVSPKLKSKGYNKVLIEPIQYYPEPTESEKVSAESLAQIQTYSGEAMIREIGEFTEIADKPGEGVARMRVALTAVGASKAGLKPHQYIPVALVLTGARAAAGAHPEDATLLLEAELTDSINGERLAVAIRSGTGERLKSMRQSGSVVTLESVKPLLDAWAKAYAKFLAETFR